MFDQFVICVSHWLFAVEYLKLALKFPLMLSQLTDEEIEKRKRKNNYIMIGLNFFFFAQMTIWAILYTVTILTD